MKEKSAYSNTEVVDYYDKTAVHYARAWDLEKSMALHYGFWNKKVRTFPESLQEMNFQMAEFADIAEDSTVLDAGCGVGGSSIYLSQNRNCQTTGASLVPHQVDKAKSFAKEKNVESLTNFIVGDYCDLPFADNSFDYIWALESVVHAEDKNAFFNEAFRLLKKGGVLVMAEYVKTKKEINPKETNLLRKWLNAWAIADISLEQEYIDAQHQAGFSSYETLDITSNIKKSAWRMYYGSFYLKVLSAGYKLYNPRVSHFADNHYKGLHYQYPALKKNLWKYMFLKFVK